MQKIYSFAQECRYHVQSGRRARDGKKDGETKKANEGKQESMPGKNENDQTEGDPKQNAKSRKMLSSTSTTPQWLLDMFNLPMDQIVFSHVQHRGGILPHFQVRMLQGDSFDNKCPGGEFVTFSRGSQFFLFSLNKQFRINSGAVAQPLTTWSCSRRFTTRKSILAIFCRQSGGLWHRQCILWPRGCVAV